MSDENTNNDLEWILPEPKPPTIHNAKLEFLDDDMRPSYYIMGVGFPCIFISPFTHDANEQEPTP